MPPDKRPYILVYDSPIYHSDVSISFANRKNVGKRNLWFSKKPSNNFYKKYFDEPPYDMVFRKVKLTYIIYTG